MASCRLVFRRSVAKDLRSVAKAEVPRVLQRIEALAEDPTASGERLSAQARYRIRQGAYRIVYEIGTEEPIVTVVRVGRRRDFDET